ncbi:hypothetical protein BW723_14305 [Polaribacter reichenbachii]|uniref:DUF4345 domain-containing protein n=1 Tax=Polaribacter reichenbachii TaxID=996801 RepID=A0A1B8U2G8_9FLAO|nr:DUF4345 domain-containing protein [Polaribacter reichenbachii]APZ47383.1 hypothetical protein BW723_14305 [Polaribacter reichenbachii]AUC18024.1 hypothetical protein BTO17_04760 [Polaribacter reichenbachii]OBY66070.1 hypothetical protein LPB301_07220 [Polaribacter reichenbachii]
MEKKIFIKVLLIISGSIGIWIGYSLLFSPVTFEASAGINLGKDINLLSEIRAPNGLLLVSGIIIILGAFFSKLTIYSIQLSCLIYLSYGLSRIISIIFDGFPSKPLQIALFVELLVGLVSLFVLLQFYKKEIKQA